jgi:metallophosphoesterase (TIGR00282 family)
MRTLIVGDVVGKPGREILKKYLDKKKSDYDFIIINGENAAGGFGITGKLADEFFSWGIDVITGGNHIWDKREMYEYLDNNDNVLRPLNYPMGVPGSGYVIKRAKNGDKVAVVSLQGRVFMTPIDCPFTKIEELFWEIGEDVKTIIIDVHAEASSEKVAMGWFLDGRTSLVFGTHTHVQTSDNKILPKGTGYITDVGMTGSQNGVIGMSVESIIPKFLTSLPQRFQIAEGNERINGLDVEIDTETGVCKKIERVDLSMDQIEAL